MTTPINATDLLVQMALDLSRTVSAEDRHAQLLNTILKGIPCDAAALLRYSGNTLHPIAMRGMTDEVMERRFVVREHPRLRAILNSPGPVRFPSDDTRPDPFDGYIPHHDGPLQVHSCMGTALYVGDQLVGALTLDALEPHKFDEVDLQLFEGFSAMAAAAFQVADRFDRLERSEHTTQCAIETLLNDARQAQGSELMGPSEAIDRVRQDLARVADSSLTVLITGERGTQRTLAARVLHQQSRRTTLIPVNCGTLGANAVELFVGREAEDGPSTAGLLEQAHCGTLLLRDVHLMPMPAQTHLLNALQQQRVLPLGATTPRPIDVRVVATADHRLTQHLRNGTFSPDLYRFISVFPVAMPALGQRLDDLPALVAHILTALRRSEEAIEIHPDTFDLLRSHLWTEHVHELRSILASAITRLRASGQTMIWPRHLLTPAVMEEANTTAKMPDLTLREAVDQYQARLITAAVAAQKGNWSAAARVLSVDRGNLHRMAKRLNITIDK